MTSTERNTDFNTKKKNDEFTFRVIIEVPFAKICYQLSMPRNSTTSSTIKETVFDRFKQDYPNVEYDMEDFCLFGCHDSKFPILLKENIPIVELKFDNISQSIRMVHSDSYRKLSKLKQ